MNSKPRAFRLDRSGLAARTGEQAEPGSVVITEEPFDAIEAADRTSVPMPARRGVPWGGILVSALGSLTVLALGLALEEMIAALFASAPWLGFVALTLTGLAVVAFLALVGREAAGIWCEQRIERLREAALDALAVKDHVAAKRVVADLSSLYGARSA